LDGLVLCGVFNFILFTYYGSRELFLYTPAWTFLVLAWLALSLQPMLAARRKTARVVNALVVALPLLELVTNLLFFRKVIAVYKAGLLPLAW